MSPPVKQSIRDGFDDHEIQFLPKRQKTKRRALAETTNFQSLTVGPTRHLEMAVHTEPSDAFYSKIPIKSSQFEHMGGILKQQQAHIYHDRLMVPSEPLRTKRQVSFNEEVVSQLRSLTAPPRKYCDSEGSQDSDQVEDDEDDASDGSADPGELPNGHEDTDHVHRDVYESADAEHEVLDDVILEDSKPRSFSSQVLKVSGARAHEYLTKPSQAQRMKLSGC